MLYAVPRGIFNEPACLVEPTSLLDLRLHPHQVLFVDGVVQQFIYLQLQVFVGELWVY